MAGNALQYLYATLTQGSNDAFVQAAVATALSGQSKSAYRLREILIDITPLLPFTNGANQELAITRKSFAAMPALTERSLIWKWKRGATALSGGGYVMPMVVREVIPEESEVLIVEDPIYIQLDSASVAAQCVATVRLGYELITISEISKLTLVANSLS